MNTTALNNEILDLRSAITRVERLVEFYRTTPMSTFDPSKRAEIIADLLEVQTDHVAAIERLVARATSETNPHPISAARRYATNIIAGRES